MVHFLEAAERGLDYRCETNFSRSHKGLFDGETLPPKNLYISCRVTTLTVAVAQMTATT